MAKAIVVTGIKDIDARLKTLEQRIQKKILRQSMRSGMKIILAEAKTRVPVLTGLTKASIKLKAGKRSRNRMRLDVLVTNAEGLTKTTAAGVKVFYPAVVEWTPGHAFMRPSYDSKGEAARDKTMDELLDGTLREAEK